MAKGNLGEKEVERAGSKALIALVLCEEEFILLRILDELLIIIVDHFNI